MNAKEFINHPVHISDKKAPSTFIPFCSFGGSGKELGNFQDSVCKVFREKIVNGQVCYEADVNQYKKDIVNWEEALQKGFSFIVDTNDEYDVKNLIREKISENNENVEEGAEESQPARVSPPTKRATRSTRSSSRSLQAKN